MENSIRDLINKAIIVNKENLNNNLKEIIKEIAKALEVNKDLLDTSNRIDITKENGFSIDHKIFTNIINNIEKEELLLGSILLENKDQDIVYQKGLTSIGNVIAISNGNPYINFELLLRNLLAGNSCILVNNGYMYATNMFLVKTIQDVLEKFNFSRDFVSMYNSEDYEDIFNDFINIDLVVVVGDRDLQNRILRLSPVKVISSGYENFDIYIEDKTNIDFIKEIMNLGLNINIYLEQDLDIEIEGAMLVSGIDEAIGQINYTGNRYAAAIFTNSNDNANKFTREVKASIVTVNTSPTIERILDIKQESLLKEKIVIYPNNYKIKNSYNFE